MELIWTEFSSVQYINSLISLHLTRSPFSEFKITIFSNATIYFQMEMSEKNIKLKPYTTCYTYTYETGNIRRRKQDKNQKTVTKQETI